MAAAMLGCARTRPAPFRNNITYIERQVSKIYKRGLRRCVGQNHYGDKVNPMLSIDRESDFIARHRFPKVIALRLAEGFGQSAFWDKKSEHDRPCCKKFVNAQWVACIGLRYLATGASLSLLVDVQGKCCKATLCNNINRFIEYLACMSSSNVKFPETEADLFDLEQKCANRYGLSGCIAFADGTYVPMVKPIANEKVFYCRKHYHALNVLIICDADQKILAIDASFGGSHQDSTVFDMSEIGRKIQHENAIGDYYIIGDNGYALTETMVTPFRQDQLTRHRTPAIDAFQAKVTSARSCVEQCNAQLKGRWRVLSKYGSGLIMRDPPGVGLIVHACAYLHNLAIEEGLAPITRLTQQDPDMEPLLRQNALIYRLNAAKRNRDRQFYANHRPQAQSDYEKGLMKRNQILREQFGERGIFLGRVQKRPRGRPRGSTNNNRLRGGRRDVSAV